MKNTDYPHIKLTGKYYEIRISTYYTKLNTILKLRDMVSDHLKEQDTPLNMLALQMAEHHIERLRQFEQFS